MAAERAERAADPSAPVLRTTIGALLREKAELHPDRDALIWADGGELRRMNYAALLQAAQVRARAILHCASPGEVVALWSRNSVDWVIAEYGCALSGTILASFNAAWTDYELQHALELTTPSLILAGLDTRGADLIERAQRAARPIAVEDLRAAPTRNADVALSEPDADAPFLIQFTSGTTGRAKGAVLSHAGALNAGMLRASMQAAVASDVFLNGSPLHHVAGSVSLVLGTLVAGAAYVVVDRVTAPGMIDLVRRTGATRIGGVPTVLKDMIEHVDFPSGGFHLTSVGIGGAEVPESLVHRIAEAFHAVVSVGYGQSECPLVANSSVADPPAIVASTVGGAPPQNAIKIIDPGSGRVVGLDEVGEVCVRSPATMIGYFRNPAATAEVIDQDGWLHTGDLGSLSATGHLTLRGRAREVIMRGGANIYPAEIENVLIQHPAVRAAAAVGVADARLGQQVAAVVVLRQGVSADPEALEAFVAERLTHYKVPRFWRFVDALPTTASGKVRKVDLAPLFADVEI